MFTLFCLLNLSPVLALFMFLCVMFKNHVTGKPDGESIVNSTAKPYREFAGKSDEDYTGAIAGGITGALIFVTIVVVIVLFVQRKIRRNQYLESVRVKRFRNQPPQKIDK